MTRHLNGLSTQYIDWYVFGGNGSWVLRNSAEIEISGNFTMSRDGSTIAGEAGIETKHVGVRVFRQVGVSGGSYSEHLIPSDQLNGRFGRAVSLSNDGATVTIGCYDANGSFSWVYRWSGSEYVKDPVKIKTGGHSHIMDNAGNLIAGQYTENGGSVSIYSTSPSREIYTGSTLAISNSGSTLVAGSSAGAFVYNFDGTSWVLDNTLLQNTLDRFDGAHVKMNKQGTRLVVSGRIYSNHNHEGRMRIYQLLNGDWDLEFEYTGGGGYVDMNEDGTVVALGMNTKPSTTYDRAGEIVVFERQNDVWVLKGGTALVGSKENEQLGIALSISNDGLTMVSSSIYGDTTQAGGVDLKNNYKHVSLYKYTGGEWTSIQILSGPDSDDAFGSSVALNKSGDKLVVGAYKTMNSQGHKTGRTYVYKLDSTTDSTGNMTDQFVQQGGSITGLVQNNGSYFNMHYGRYVGMDSSGQMVVIGSHSYRTDLHPVETYQYIDNKWSQNVELPITTVTGDPYIKVFGAENVTYKLPGKCAFYRIFQYKDVIINADVTSLGKSDQLKLQSGIHAFEQGFYLSGFYLTSTKGTYQFDRDLNPHSSCKSHYIVDPVEYSEVCSVQGPQEYTRIVIQLDHDITVELRKYKSAEVVNGISITLPLGINQSEIIGVSNSSVHPKLLTIKSLSSQTKLKIANGSQTYRKAITDDWLGKYAMLAKQTIESLKLADF